MTTILLLIDIFEKNNTKISTNQFKYVDTISPLDTCKRFLGAQICAYDNH